MLPTSSSISIFMAFSERKPEPYSFGIFLDLAKLGLSSLEGIETIRGAGTVTMLVLYLNNFTTLSDKDILILRECYPRLKHINLSMCNIETKPHEISRIEGWLPGVRVIVGNRSFGGRSVKEFKDYWETKGIFLGDDWK